MAALSGVVDLEEGLTQEEKARALLCAAEVEAVCRKYDCQMVTAPFKTGDQWYAETHILPRQERRA